MAGGNNSPKQFSYPFMDNENDDYVGAGDSSLFDDLQPGDQQGFGETAYADESMANYRSPTSVLDEFNFGNLGDAGAASTLDPTAIGPQPAVTLPEANPPQVTLPQLALPQVTLPRVPTDPVLLGLNGTEENSPQNQNLFPMQGRLPSLSLPEQQSSGTLPGFNNGADQAAAGQGAMGAPMYGGQPVPPNNGQFGMYPNPYVPEGQPNGIAQAYGAPNSGYPANGYMPMPVPPQAFRPAPPVNPYQQHATAPLQLPDGKRLTHNRNQKKDPGNDPSQIYTPPTSLGPWGPVVGPKEQHHLFEYFKATAELRPAVTYTKDQLITFFRGEGHPNPNRALTLWIQNTPAQSNDRYAAGPSSGKCRFEGCPAPQRTILKGFFRVAFDEFSDLTGGQLDPMHNAGYMHLHCFETQFDLGYLIHHGARNLRFNILPDNRQFPYETRHPASINRDHSAMIHAYNQWVEGQKVRADHIEAQNRSMGPTGLGQWYTGLQPTVIPPHAQRLGCILVEKHLTHEVKGRSKTREARGGVHIGVHKGDLDMFHRLRRQDSVRRRREARRRASEREDDDEGEETARVEDDERSVKAKGDEDEEVMPQGGTRSRPSRQNKTRKRDADSDDELPKAKKAKHAPAGDEVNRVGDDIYSGTPPRDLGPGPQSQPGHPARGDRPSFPPPRPFPQQPAAGPRTRKRSRETGEGIIDMVSSPGNHLTRSSVRGIQTLLGTEPPHVQDQVLARVPEYAQQVLQPIPGFPYQDRLEERVSRLPKRQRRDVEAFVGKQETGRDGKRFHSW